MFLLQKLKKQSQSDNVSENCNVVDSVSGNLVVLGIFLFVLAEFNNIRSNLNLMN